jgi:ribosomal protein S18 acetylase RimI-like enzyme
MSSNIQIREFRFPQDYEGALSLWENMETGIKVGPSDSLVEVEKKLQRDPDLFLVAELNSQIVGTVIGGYDGRRGMIYHLAVPAELRNQGIATQLLFEVEKRLISKGCLKSYLLVFADNLEAIQFYEHRGWREMKEDLILGKEFQ